MGCRWLCCAGYIVYRGPQLRWPGRFVTPIISCRWSWRLVCHSLVSTTGGIHDRFTWYHDTYAGHAFCVGCGHRISLAALAGCVSFDAASGDSARSGAHGIGIRDVTVDQGICGESVRHERKKRRADARSHLASGRGCWMCASCRCATDSPDPLERLKGLELPAAALPGEGRRSGPCWY